MSDSRGSNANRQERISRALYLTAESYGYPLSNELMDMWFKLLSPYSVDDIDAAFSVWFSSYGDRKFDFMPRPAHIIEIIEKEKSGGLSIEARAQQQWRIVMDAVRRYGSRHPQKFADPITANLIRTQFTWSYLCDMPESKETWEQNRWCEAFNLANEIYKDLVEIEASEKLRPLVDGIGQKMPDINFEVETDSLVTQDAIRAYKEKKKKAFEASIENQPTDREKRIAELQEQAEKMAKSEEK